ncbi:hypothetical protein TNIN_93881 [Trichonephila inaurata madagascariensis]|uniref:Uncharacterized protein n=1 Tax=Trichonephila inaurata madagascariensis TaxID=2747483 RepID=A0A8X6YNQ4_9ARAC|nr:hypothetical protein TNIN_93881 [Trichonephila inaurata madagascariensis]
MRGERPLQDSDLTGIPLQCRVRSWSHCISNTKECDSTLHLAFSPLEEPLQDSYLTGIPLQGRVTAWSNCVSIMLRTVTLRFTQPQESSPRLGRSSYRFFFPSSRRGPGVMTSFVNLKKGRSDGRPSSGP